MSRAMQDAMGYVATFRGMRLPSGVDLLVAREGRPVEYEVILRLGSNSKRWEAIIVGVGGTMQMRTASLSKAQRLIASYFLGIIKPWSVLEAVDGDRMGSLK